MHPTLRKGPLFYKTPPIFHFFYEKNTPPPFHFLPTGLHAALLPGRSATHSIECGLLLALFYHSKKHIVRVLPTRWRRKPAGIDTERNYVTVTL